MTLVALGYSPAMRKIACLLVVLVVSIGYARTWVSELEAEQDPFTRNMVCSQSGGYIPEGDSLVGNTSLTLSSYLDGTISLATSHYGSGRVIFGYPDMDFRARAGQHVLMLLPDGTILQFVAEYVNYSQHTTREFVGVRPDLSSLYALLASPGDVLVRLDGLLGHLDFNINHEVIVGLAQGFGRTCL